MRGEFSGKRVIADVERVGEGITQYAQGFVTDFWICEVSRWQEVVFLKEISDADDSSCPSLDESSGRSFFAPLGVFRFTLAILFQIIEAGVENARPDLDVGCVVI